MLETPKKCYNQEVLECQRKKKQLWVTNDLLNLCGQRMGLKRKRKRKLEAAFKYKEGNFAIRKGIKGTRENWIEGQ